jgi:hypothetical protein
MKKLLLTLAFAVLSSFGAFAQSYYFLKTIGGTTSEYNARNSAGTTDLILAESTPKTKTLSASQTFPFTWNFYGQPVTAYKVSSSGYLTFNTSQTTDENNNVALPSSSAPISSIFAFWDNLKVVFATGVNTAFPQGVRSWTYGTKPNRVHVVQWQLLQKDDNAANLTNVTQFAIRFFEANGGNKFDIIHNFGSGTHTATVGVVDILGTNYTQVAGSPNINYGGATSSNEPASYNVYTFDYGTQPQYDVKLTDVQLEKFVGKDQSTNVGFSFINNGGATLTSFRVNYSVDGGAPVSQNVTNVSVIGSGMGTYSFSHATPYRTSAAGRKSFKVWVDNLNGSNEDLNHKDDTLTKSITVVSSTVKRKSLQEVFTASTCLPCNPGNEKLQTILHQRMGGYTVIKYQYYFPGTGDPYFTPECLARGEYYAGINSVPSLQVDGKWNDNPNDYDVNLFDAFYNKPAVVSITANQTIVGNTITINAKVKPVSSLPGNYKIHFAVLEKTTKRNVKSNGETKFHWVMKKMLPDANGSVINFTNDAEQTISKSFTFPGGFRLPTSAVTSSGAYNGINLATENSVEEMNDLIGVVFVQDESDKEVLQSEWSGNAEWDYYASTVETSVGATGVTIYPNPAQTTFTINAANVEGLAAVKVLDITGKEVMTANAKGGMETALDVSALHNGIYFVHITVNGTTAVQKLTISK